MGSNQFPRLNVSEITLALKRVRRWIADNRKVFCSQNIRCTMLSKVMFLPGSRSLGTGAQVMQEGRVSIAINESAKRMRKAWGEGGATMHSGECASFEAFYSRDASASVALVQNGVTEETGLSHVLTGI